MLWHLYSQCCHWKPVSCGNQESCLGEGCAMAMYMCFFTNPPHHLPVYPCVPLTPTLPTLLSVGQYYWNSCYSLVRLHSRMMTLNFQLSSDSNNNVGLSLAPGPHTTHQSQFWFPKIWGFSSWVGKWHLSQPWFLLFCTALYSCSYHWFISCLVYC